jgi:hypothetical protein
MSMVDMVDPVFPKFAYKQISLSHAAIFGVL